MDFYFYFSREISVDTSFTEKKNFFFFSPFLCLASFYGSLTSRRLVNDGKSGYKGAYTLANLLVREPKSSLMYTHLKVVGTGKPTFSFAVYCESLFLHACSSECSLVRRNRVPILWQSKLSIVIV